MPDYRIEYSIKRFDEAEGDFVEIGFGGSSGGSVDDAAYAVESDIEHRRWETRPSMPDPAEVARD
jgi:hypothetical protein